MSFFFSLLALEFCYCFGHGMHQIYTDRVLKVWSHLSFYPKATFNSFERPIMVGLPSPGASRKHFHCLTFLLFKATSACPICYRYRDRVLQSSSQQGLVNCNSFYYLFPSEEGSFTWKSILLLFLTSSHFCYLSLDFFWLARKWFFQPWAPRMPAQVYKQWKVVDAELWVQCH